MSHRLKTASAVAFLTLAMTGACFGRPQENRDTEVATNEPAAAPAPGATTATLASQGSTPFGRPVATGDSPNRFAVGVQVGTLGIGPQFAYRLTHRFNVRGGANFMSFSHAITVDQITYGATLRFRSAEAHLDWFFWGPLHLSPGALLYNGNGISATVSVPTGQTFELNGTDFESSTPPLGGAGELTLDKVAPSILFGIGNMIPRSGRHFAGQFEIGGIYEGSPNITLNLTGTVCQPPNSSGPTCQSVSAPFVQNNVTAEQQKLNHDAASFKFYPVISGGFSFAF
jgi:hypothetical protein